MPERSGDFQARENEVTELSSEDTQDGEYKDEWLRPWQTAAYVKSSESTLAKMRLKGNGPTYTKFGRMVLYAKRDLDKYLAARRRRSTSDPDRAA